MDKRKTPHDGESSNRKDRISSTPIIHTQRKMTRRNYDEAWQFFEKVHYEKTSVYIISVARRER